MGDPARARVLRVRFAAVALLLASCAAASFVACGLEVVASGPSKGAVADPDEGGAALIEDAAAFDGDAAQSTTCDPPRTMCGGSGGRCIDTSADPANCGACGAACRPGQTCNDGTCDVLCVGDTLRCGVACVDPTSDPANCGACGTICPTDKNLCVASVCKKDCDKATQTECDPDGGADAGLAYCATTATDRNNCGACGVGCTTNQTCVAGACKDLCVGPARVGDVFSPTMVGCVDRRQWSERAKTCPPGSVVCTAAQWNARPAAKKPTFNYWTDDYLQWRGTGPASCVAVTNGNGGACSGFPMHVCAASTDPMGNTCTWTHCGYVTLSPDQYYGGCTGDYYAGALCCTP